MYWRIDFSSIRAPPLAASWFSRIRWEVPGFFQPVVCPPPPALGHLGALEQPSDFLAITGVDAKNISDGEIMIGFLDYPDLIPDPHIPLDDDSQVSPGPQRVGEAAGEQLVVHPNPEPPARDSRLGNLENRGPDLPPLADERVVHLDPLGREVFAKLTVAQHPADLPFPPPCVFD